MLDLWDRSPPRTSPLNRSDSMTSAAPSLARLFAVRRRWHITVMDSQPKTSATTFRERAGLSLTDASARAGISSAYLRAIESGRLRCSFVLAEKLSRIYDGAPLDAFLLRSNARIPQATTRKRKTPSADRHMRAPSLEADLSNAPKEAQTVIVPTNLRRTLPRQSIASPNECAATQQNPGDCGESLGLIIQRQRAPGR